MANEEKAKQKMGFTIIKNDPTDGHKGFGIGSLSLENVSPVILDIEEGTASVEIGAMHARSDVERGIKFTTDRADSEGGKPYWLVWVTIDHKEDGPYYAGVTACEMVVNREKRRGYKILADHVNKMDKSMKRHIIVNHMDAPSKKVLASFLEVLNPDLWARSEEQLRQDLFA
ncbi:YwhD family protein [Lysinibacillus pakistanensis]|uniref:YwhD family protein n=1 Tax=Lysinibacillus pakistanensis TaxID=759811 RepID=A0AAX3WWZ3_9BACI|nr:YwhD family protein [Lysinibacillus pakistanensis]MDM5231665.1 YwhD family protein [Lysinibacillus pakistanensis]WHY47206.1 YwhD family protein [Lysinibacillus pakistanensis]WHY52215.1 YwhD family protein [Lysinibacillus pakistanensis]